MRHLALFSLKRPLIAAFSLVCLSLFAVAGLTRLGFDDGMESAFAGQTSSYLDYLVDRERFTPAESDIVVHFQSDTPFSGEQLQAIRSFTLEAAFAPHVDSTLSMFALRTPPRLDAASQPILPLDLIGETDLANRLQEARRHPLGGERLLSQDFHQTLVLVTLLPSQSDLESARQTHVALDELIADTTEQVDGSLTATLTGMVPIRQIVLDGLLRDLLVLNVIGIGIGSLICIIALRSVLLSALTGIPAALALLWVLGGMGWLGLEINTLTNAIPVLILVLALCDSLHLTYEVRRRAAHHSKLSDAIAEAVVRVAPACALTSITTGIAFAALLISPSELVRSLGWSGVLATLVSLLAVLLAHPLVFLAAGRSRMVAPVLERLLRRSPQKNYVALQGHGFWRFGIDHARPVAVLSVLALIVGLVLFSAARPEYSFLENVSTDNPALQALHQIDDALTPTGSIDIPVQLSGGTPDDLQRVEAVVQAALAAIPDAKVTSLSDLVRWAGLTNRSPDLQMLQPLLALMTDTQRQRYLSSDEEWALVRLFVPDEGAQITQGRLEAIGQSLGEAGLLVGATANPTGLLAMSSNVGLEMIGHLNISFTVAVLAASLFIAVWFGNVLYGLVALVPNILPIVCVGAWLYIGGNGLQFSSAIALTIAFGIAVDDTVHVLNRLSLTAPVGKPFDRQSVRRVFSDLSPVLVTTTVVLAFGMIGSQFSSIPTIAYFGTLCVIVFALALISVLVVLPALMCARGAVAPTAKKKVV